MRHLIITYLPSNEVSLEVLSILLTSYSQCQAQFLTHNRLLHITGSYKVTCPQGKTGIGFIIQMLLVTAFTKLMDI